MLYNNNINKTGTFLSDPPYYNSLYNQSYIADTVTPIIPAGLMITETGLFMGVEVTLDFMKTEFP